MVENKGLRYNGGKPQYSLIDYTLLEPMVRTLEYGAHKYSVFEDEKGNKIKGSEVTVEESKKLKLISSGRDNWKKGFPMKELIDSAYRHINAYNAGELVDKESGCHHLGNLMCNILFIFNQEKLNANL